ncbi:MAG: hypothetical protein JXQ96_01825 [Cyclobacteriaceae bacterium]
MAKIKALFQGWMEEVINKKLMEVKNTTNSTIEPERLLSLSKAAERLGCTRQNVSSYHIKQRGLKTYREKFINTEGEEKLTNQMIKENELNEYIRKFGIQ